MSVQATVSRGTTPETPSKEFVGIEQQRPEHAFHTEDVKDENAGDVNNSANNSASIACNNCQTSTTPLWRRDEMGQILCNACGLFLKLHGRHRPMSLKTDVIKSRNRTRHRPVPSRERKSSAKQQPSPNNGPVHHLYSLQQSHPAGYPSLIPGIQSSSGSTITSPQTPSSVFSYTNSPTMPPYAYNGHMPIGSAPLAPQSPAATLSPAHPSGQRQTAGRHGGPASPGLPGVAAMTNGVAAPLSPHILTPLSRPLSPAGTITSNIPTQRPRGEVMSEQLRPRSPPDSLDRIPPLRHVSAGRFALHKQTTHYNSGTTTPPAVLLHQKHQQHPPTPSLSKLSELELVNDLLRSRVAQLEKTEAQARESEVSLRSQLNETESEISKVTKECDALRDSEAALRRQIVDVCEERDKLKTRINDLENKLRSHLTQQPQSPQGSQSEADLHRIKRIKVSDML